MTKHRPPLSVHAALDRIAGHFAGGYAELAPLIDRKEHTCRAWSDPEKREKVSVEDAIRLDLEFQAAGGIGAPIFETYALQLQQAAGARFATQLAISRLLPEVIRENSEAEIELAVLAQPGAGASERRAAVKETGEAIARLQQARHAAEESSSSADQSEHHQTGPPPAG